MHLFSLNWEDIRYKEFHVVPRLCKGGGKVRIVQTISKGRTLRLPMHKQISIYIGSFFTVYEKGSFEEKHVHFNM